MRTFLALLLALSFSGVALAENPVPTAPAHPPAHKYTQRAVTELAVFDMCDLTKVRECVIWNQLDVAIMIKYVTTASVCTDVPITTATDTDVIQIPSGATYSEVIGQENSGRDHTICAKAVATPSSGAVYTAEAS